MEEAAQLSGFEDETVDAVTCTWGMESSPDPMAVLRVSTATNPAVPMNLKRVISNILRWYMKPQDQKSNIEILAVHARGGTDSGTERDEACADR